MTEIKKHLYLRDRRDRLIDLLGFAETYPLRDLPVAVERLVVPAGTAAGIPVGASQRDCTYALWERESETLATRTENGSQVPAEEPGDGDEILLLSPGISVDTGYRIRSTRQTTGRWVYLHEMAEIKTGLSAKLSARVLSGIWLDKTLESPTPQDARVVEYGTIVEVEIQYSQNGVQYRLVHIVNGVEETLSESDVAGNFRTIVLSTKPLTGDTDIRIRAIRPTEETLLDIVLPVVVRASSDVAVTVDGTHIIEYDQSATVVIVGSQLGIRYRLFAKSLKAGDFLQEGAPEETSVAVAGEGADQFTVSRPAFTPVWTVPEGFKALGAEVLGTGADLPMPAGPLTEDTLILVRARNSVQLPSGAWIAADAPLKQAVVLLVRPNPAQALCFQVFYSDDTTSGALRMTGGQQGVFYSLSDSAGGESLGQSGYFYERIGTSPEQNVGLGSLAVGRDLVIGRNAWTDLTVPELRGIESIAVDVDLVVSSAPEGFADIPPEQRASQSPEPPIVDTPPLAIGTSLFGVATKSRTHLSRALASTPILEPLPLIEAHKDEPEGPVTSVVVQESVIGASYSLLVNGLPEGAPQAGDGQDLTFTLVEPQEGSILDVVIRRGEAPSIVVEQLVRVRAESAVPAA